MDTVAQGNAAEAAVLHALTLAGVQVLVPFGDGLAFDLAAVMPNGEILRIQVKSGRVRNRCVLFNTCGSDHGTGRKDYRGRADCIAAYVSESDSVYVIPVEECPAYVCTLRLDAPRNNQRLGVRLAHNYTVASWLTAPTAPSVTAAANVFEETGDKTVLPSSAPRD